MAHTRFFLATLIAIATLVPLTAASAQTTLFDMNKLGIHGISAIEGNCAGASLTPESYLYCAIKEKTFEGELGIEIRIGSTYLRPISTTPAPFTKPDAVDNSPFSENFAFSKAGWGFNVIFLDQDVIRIYTASDASAAATAILKTLFDEAAPAGFKKGCELLVASNARAVAFKNCVPEEPPATSAAAPAGSSPAEDRGLTYGILPDSLLPPPEVQTQCQFISPVKNHQVTSAFDTPRRYAGRSYSHDGIDLVGNRAIIAPADGKITSVFGVADGGACGNGIQIEFTGCSAKLGKPIYGTFCHLAELPALKAGQAVKQGQKIATMGGSGSANGAVHLHYGIRLGCVEASCAVDPKPYLASGYTPKSTAASPASLEFADTPTPRKSGIVAVKNNPGRCPEGAAFQNLQDFNGGESACIYFYINPQDGAADKFFDVALAGYGNSKGGCFAVRAVLHKPGVQYPSSYLEMPSGVTPVYHEQLPQRSTYSGFYFMQVPVRKNFGKPVKGLVLNMYFSDSKTDFSRYTENEGIARSPRTDQKTAGDLSCQTFLPTAGGTNGATKNVGAVGDSISEGYKTYLPDALKKKSPKSSVDVYSEVGIPTQGILDSFRRNILAHQPTYNAVVIQGGVNDIAGERPLSETMANIDATIKEAKSRGMKVVLVTIGPWSGYASWTAAKQAKTDQLNDWLKKKEGAGVVVADVSGLGGGKPAKLKPQYDGDGLHPNAEGYRFMAEKIAQGIYDVFGKDNSANYGGTVACEKVVDVPSINRKYLPDINRVVAKYTQEFDYGGLPSVPWQYVCKIIKDESSFSPAIRSPAGATGLTQLMPGTAAGLQSRYGTRAGYSCQCADRITGIEENICCGVAYLREGVKQYNGDLLATAARYNGGDGGAEAYLKSGGKQFVWADYQDRYATYHYVQSVRKFLQEQGVAITVAQTTTPSTG